MEIVQQSSSYGPSLFISWALRRVACLELRLVVFLTFFLRDSQNPFSVDARCLYCRTSVSWPSSRARPRGGLCLIFVDGLSFHYHPWCTRNSTLTFFPELAGPELSAVVHCNRRTLSLARMRLRQVRQLAQLARRAQCLSTADGLKERAPPPRERSFCLAPSNGAITDPSSSHKASLNERAPYHV